MERTGFIWHSIGTSCGLLWARWWNLGFHKLRGISLLRNCHFFNSYLIPLCSVQWICSVWIVRVWMRTCTKKLSSLDKTKNVWASSNRQPDVARNTLTNRMFRLSSVRLQNHEGRIALNTHWQDDAVSGLSQEYIWHCEMVSKISPHDTHIFKHLSFLQT